MCSSDLLGANIYPRREVPIRDPWGKNRSPGLTRQAPEIFRKGSGRSKKACAIHAARIQAVQKQLALLHGQGLLAQGGKKIAGF